jgi:redox-sensitive bicupin YhaK (pirin superfamily)
MKRTITTEVFAIASPYSRITPEDLRSGDIGPHLMYSTTEMAGVEGYVVVGKGTVTVELHDSSEVAANQVAVLREKAKKIRMESAEKLAIIEDQIRNLQALTYEPANDEAA